MAPDVWNIITLEGIMKAAGKIYLAEFHVAFYIVNVVLHDALSYKGLKGVPISRDLFF
ncbi:hypothetical protein ES705_25056 [subsurface metagenome]